MASKEIRLVLIIEVDDCDCHTHNTTPEEIAREIDVFSNLSGFKLNDGAFPVSLLEQGNAYLLSSEVLEL